MRKDEEVRRAVEAFNKAVEFADRKDANRDSEQEMIAGAKTTNIGYRSESRTADPSPNSRRPRPPIRYKTSIDEYTPMELVALIHWINSDGQLRTDEQILDEILPELGFSRRGVRIENAIRQAIRMAHYSTH